MRNIQKRMRNECLLSYCCRAATGRHVRNAANVEINIVTGRMKTLELGRPHRWKVEEVNQMLSGCQECVLSLPKGWTGPSNVYIMASPRSVPMGQFSPISEEEGEGGGEIHAPGNIWASTWFHRYDPESLLCILLDECYLTDILVQKQLGF